MHFLRNNSNRKDESSAGKKALAKSEKDTEHSAKLQKTSCRGSLPSNLPAPPNPHGYTVYHTGQKRRCENAAGFGDPTPSFFYTTPVYSDHISIQQDPGTASSFTPSPHYAGHQQAPLRSYSAQSYGSAQRKDLSFTDENPMPLFTPPGPSYGTGAPPVSSLMSSQSPYQDRPMM